MTRIMTSAALDLPASDHSAMLWMRAARVIVKWSARRRSRIALMRLDDRLLRDVGLDALTAEAEAAQPFWR